MTKSNKDEFLPSKEVRGRYGVSDQTIYRWLKDSTTGFPAPTYIGPRRYWSLSELEAWEKSLAKRREDRSIATRAHAAKAHAAKAAKIVPAEDQW